MRKQPCTILPEHYRAKNKGRIWLLSCRRCADQYELAKIHADDAGAIALLENHLRLHHGIEVSSRILENK